MPARWWTFAAWLPADSCVFTNITDRKRSEQRLTFLAEAGTLLASSTNTEKILTQLVDLVISARSPTGVRLWGQNDDDLPAKASAHRDPAKLTTFVTAQPGAIRTIIADALRTGDPVLVTQIQARKPYDGKPATGKRF